VYRGDVERMEDLLECAAEMVLGIAWEFFLE
jgi:hypothetical protein